MISNKLLAVNNWAYYFLLCAISIVFTYAFNYFILTEDLYFASLNEQFTYEQIQKILKITRSWTYLGYFFIPVIIIIRILYSSFCLFLGDLFQESQWGFKHLFNISLKADIIFSLNVICNFYYYAFSEDYRKLDELNVNCLSFLKVTGKEDIPSWLVFAFNSINLFELFYIFLLVIIIKNTFKTSYLKSSVFVLLTYGVGNYLYIVAITFLSLNLQ